MSTLIRKLIHLLTALAIVFIVVESKPFSSLVSIPTHHGIDAAVHLSGGGAVATRKKGTTREGEPMRIATYYQKNDVNHPNSAVAVASRALVTRDEDALSPMAIVCMSLLALQFGIQPILVRRYTPQTIVRSSVILVQEAVKFVIAGVIYVSGTRKENRIKDFEGE